MVWVMKLTLWRDDVTLAHPVASALQRHDSRSRLLLSVDHEGVTGFGEVDPQPFFLNGDPGIADVVQELDGIVLLQIQGAYEREGALPSWTRIARFAGSRPSSSPAICLVEMALLDRELHCGGRDLDDLWPKVFDTPLQGTASLLDDDEWALEPTVARVRLKTKPGVVSAVALRRLAALKVPVLLDFNCSATCDADVLSQLGQIGAIVEVVGVEQPFAPGNIVDHARLAEQLDVPLSLDEGVRSVRDLAQIVRYGAAQIVCVKPARVGGYANARTVIERAKEMGLRPYLGGFFESPFARSVNRRLAEYLVDEPSDVGVVATSGVEAHDQLDVVAGGFGLRPSPAWLAGATRIATFA